MTRSHFNGATARMTTEQPTDPVTALVLYDSMCRAIEQCHQVDEVLSVKDKARALEVYAMQVKNTEAERKACDIRLRAERRLGELLKELHRGDAGRPASVIADEIAATVAGIKSPYQQALHDNLIPERTARRYQQLADVPAADFEQALADPAAKPSTTRLIGQIRDPVQQPQARTHSVWGDDIADAEALVHEVAHAIEVLGKVGARHIAPCHLMLQMTPDDARLVDAHKWQCLRFLRLLVDQRGALKWRLDADVADATTGGTA